MLLKKEKCMFVDLDELKEEIKMVKGLVKDAGPGGRELLRNVKKAEALLDKAKLADAKGDYDKSDEFVEQIRALLQ